VPTAKARARGDKTATQLAGEALGLAIRHPEPAAGGKILPPHGAKAAAHLSRRALQAREWHDACLLSYTYANCAKISSRQTEPPPTGSSSNGVVADKSQGEGSAAAAAAQAKDHVTLTDSARSLQKIEEAVARTPVVNADKVAAVKQAIGSGTYKIDAGRIAGKMLKYERGLK
jgi:negative regulator of flagellin synthesis FlgM